MICFGPVQSRRLGKSLGINNIPGPKICSYNCIYCQVGKTRHQGVARQAFFDPEIIYKSVNEHLLKIKPEDKPDYLTFVSNGEPTADIMLGKSISLLKTTGIPVAVISNGSLLFQETARADLALADWVSIKMDAGQSDTWMSVNQPAGSPDFGTVMKNIGKFAGEFTGILCTETMLIRGINDTIVNLTALSEYISYIDPHAAYLAVPTRPTSYPDARAADIGVLNEAWQIFNVRGIRTEFLTGFEGSDTGYTGNIYSDILNITSVHPLREDAMQKLLENDKADFSVVTSLINQRLIRSTVYNGEKFYLRDYNHGV